MSPDPITLEELDPGTVEELAELAGAAGYRVQLAMMLEHADELGLWSALVTKGTPGRPRYESSRSVYAPTAALALAGALDRLGVAR